MSSPAPPLVASKRADERLDVLFAELAELTGQRNAVDGRIVELVAEIDLDALWAAAGTGSVAALVAWKTRVSPSRAATIAASPPGRGVSPLCGRAAGGPVVPR